MDATMNPAMNPAATDHVPVFMTGPGGSDVLLQVVGWVLVVSVLAVGLLFLRLHTLPERIAHRGHKLQFEIVAVLGLLALFTHIHLFWVAGLLLALIDFPDFRGMFGRIAQALESIAYNTGRSRLIRRETTTPPAIAAADQRQGSEELTDA